MHEDSRHPTVVAQLVVTINTGQFLTVDVRGGECPVTGRNRFDSSPIIVSAITATAELLVKQRLIKS